MRSKVTSTVPQDNSRVGGRVLRYVATLVEGLQGGSTLRSCRQYLAFGGVLGDVYVDSFDGDEERQEDKRW